MYELQRQSSSRNGVPVLWITIHTAEGPTDEFPSRPDLDAGSARDLLRFFEGKTDRSCHAICDDDILIDNLVSYDRAAWTLRNGNVRSDNLEMCGLASWSRAEWLTHDGMLRNAARWVVGRLRARSMTPRRLSVADVRARIGRGYIDHNTYTVATGDGTHWDVGPNFPWDVFGNYVQSFFNPPKEEEDPMAGYSLADDARGKDYLEKVIPRAALLAVTGDSNTVYDSEEAKPFHTPDALEKRLDRVETAVTEILAILKEEQPSG